MKTLTCCLCFLLLASFARTEELTSEQWRADLDYFEREFPAAHKNPFRLLTEKEFHDEVGRLRQQIGKMTKFEIIVELSRIVTKVGDGHTLIPLGHPQMGFHILPVRMRFFTDGLYVIQAPEEYREAIGAKVVKIGDTEADEAFRRVKEVTSHDNEMTLLDRGPVALIVPEVLAALKITSDAAVVPLTLERSGRQFVVRFLPVTADRDPSLPHPDWPDVFGTQIQKPLWLRSTEKLFWYEYLPQNKILYVQYNEVANSPEKTVAAFFDEVFNFVAKNPVDKFVLDMRWNGGGNNTLNKPIMLGIVRSEKINQKGKLFAIISRRTFSAAQNCVNLLEKFTNVTFIGEPTGATPNHYGDAAHLLLPNSKVEVRASTLWWQDMDPRDLRVWTAPEIAVDLSFADYAMGKDPALDAILNYRVEPSISERILSSIESSNLVEARNELLRYKNDPRHKYADTEAEINRLGYTLLQKKSVEAAVAVLRWNLEDYPRSWNAYDSYAEALEAQGKREEAIANYRKALELNPKSKSSRDALSRLLNGAR